VVGDARSLLLVLSHQVIEACGLIIPRSIEPVLVFLEIIFYFSFTVSFVLNVLRRLNELVDGCGGHRWLSSGVPSR
jgi:hypothetical protein